MKEIQSLHSPSDCEKHYRQLHSICGDILNLTFLADEDRAHSKSHNYIADFEKWIQVLSSRPEVNLLKAALREYQFALLSLVQGQYREAFIALRLFLEHSLGAVYLSVNEIELRAWLRGCRDINWKPLVDLENGVFSKRFVTAFYEELTDEAPYYCAIAEQVYRECSEYVHGNYHTYDILSQTLEFKKNVFVDWHNKARSVRLVVSFALCIRYLAILDKTNRGLLEPILIDELGHLPVIRMLFDGSQEVK